MAGRVDGDDLPPAVVALALGPGHEEGDAPAGPQVMIDHGRRVARGPPPLLEPLPRAYLVAGTREPFFLKNATRWADALRAAGGDVVVHERVRSHGDTFWSQEFPLMVAWAFRR